MILFSRRVKSQFVCIIKENIKHLSVSSAKCAKVAVLGANGGIGQPLSLLLKQFQLVTELSLYDIMQTHGVAADLSHIDTKCKVTGYVGPEQLRDSLKGAEVIVMPAGLPRRPGMTRDDLFVTNASIVRNLMHVIVEVAPKALVAIITNPINSMVPIAAEVMKNAGVFDPNRLFGVTTLDIVRANTFVAKAKGLDPEEFNVPVVGGHAGVTIVPLVSQSTPSASFSQDELQALTIRIQEAETEVVKAKAGSGSATLSMAYSGARFIFALCRALSGESDIVECCYVQSDITEAKYFASPVLLGPGGVQKNLGLGKLTDYEDQLIKAAIPIIQKNIQTGEDFINKK